MVRSFISYMLTIDQRLCVKVSTYTGKKYLDSIMYYVTRSGDGPLYIFIAAFVLLMYRSSGYHFVLAGLLAFAIELMVQKVVKRFVKRQRPGISLQGIRFLVPPPDQFSFPSGHTAGAYIMATLTIYFAPVLVFPVFIWAGLMGFSRIYNGVHYPSDVVAGALLGIFSTVTAVFIIF